MRPASAQDFVGSSEDAPPAARRPQSSIGFRPNDYEDYEDETDHTPLFEMLAPRGSLMTPSRLRPHSAAAVLQETVRPIRQEDKRRSRLLYIAPAPDFGQGSSFDYFSGVGDVTRVLNDRIKELNESLEPSAPRRGWAEQKGAQEEEEDPVILAAFRRKQAQAAFDATYLASLQALQIARGGGPSAALEAARLEIARKKEKKEDEKQASKPQPSLAMKQAASGASKFSLKGTAQKIANMTAAKHSIRGIALDAVTALHTFDRGRDKTRSKTRAFVNERLMEKVAVYRGDSHKREELKERCEWHVAMAKKQHPESAIKRNIKKAVAWGQEEWEMQQRIKDRRERLHEMAKQRRMAMEAQKEERERSRAMREVAPSAPPAFAPPFNPSQPPRPSSFPPGRTPSNPLRPASSPPGRKGGGAEGGGGGERHAYAPKLRQALAALAMKNTD